MSLRTRSLIPSAVLGVLSLIGLGLVAVGTSAGELRASVGAYCSNMYYCGSCSSAEENCGAVGCSYVCISGGCTSGNLVVCDTE